MNDEALKSLNLEGPTFSNKPGPERPRAAQLSRAPPSERPVSTALHCCRRRKPLLEELDPPADSPDAQANPRIDKDRQGSTRMTVV